MLNTHSHSNGQFISRLIFDQRIYAWVLLVKKYWSQTTGKQGLYWDLFRYETHIHKTHTHTRYSTENYWKVHVFLWNSIRGWRIMSYYLSTFSVVSFGCSSAWRMAESTITDHDCGQPRYLGSLTKQMPRTQPDQGRCPGTTETCRQTWHLSEVYRSWSFPWILVDTLMDEYGNTWVQSYRLMPANQLGFPGSKSVD
jgi:hypothetical protein